VGTELFHADAQPDRRTDMTKLVVPFSEFCERTKKNLDGAMYPSRVFRIMYGGK
jgi:hypothetical protein